MENRAGYKKTELGWIPEEWRVVKLGEIAEFKNGKAHEQDINEQGEYIVVNSKFISTDGAIFKYTTQNLCPLFSGNIVMVMSDVPNGRAFAKCFLIKQDNKYTLNQRICSIIAVKIDNLFLLNVLNRNKYYLQFDNGVGQTNLKKNEVLECPIPLPPLPEQQKIASILTTVDDKISSIEAQIQQTEQLKQGLMAKLLTEGIGHTEFKDTEIGRIPKAWEVVYLSDTRDKNDNFSLSGGPFGSDLQSKDYTTEGIRVIQLQNIGDGIFIDNHRIFTSKQKADELYKCLIYPDEIIIAKMAEPLARACKIPHNEEKYLMCSDGIRLRVDKTLFDNNYILYTINSEYFRKNAEANSTGTTRLRIGLNTLRQLNICVPPLPEQQQIASILSSVDDKIDILQSKKSAYTTLKKGLMAKLLTGQIRVRI